MRKGDDGHGQDRHVEPAEGKLERSVHQGTGAPRNADDGCRPECLRGIDQHQGESKSGDKCDHFTLRAHRLLASELSVEEPEVEADPGR